MANLLVVDDSRLSRAMLGRALTDVGHTVREAANGIEGLDAYRAEKPDLLLTDLLMPEMDGFGLVEAIRAEDPELPIIVTSADIQDSSKDRCDKLGVNKMITKPIKSAPLLAAVDDVLQLDEVGA